jgi:flavocytochrome c
LQEEQGIKDSPEIFYEDMRKAGLGLNHPHLLRILAEKATEAILWTKNKVGVKYLDRLDRFGGHSVARCLTTLNHTGADFVKAQVRWLNQKGVEIRTRCLLERLLTDRQGTVCGVRIRSGYEFPDKNSGVIMNIQARRAVILATGGFGNDIQFRMNQNPVLNESVDSTNHRGATADGLISALEIGAIPVHLSWIQLGPWGCADEKGYGRGASFASYGVYPYGIVVNPANGLRIVNEWADRRTRSDAIFKTGNICIGIVDSEGVKNVSQSLEHSLKRGYVKVFQSLGDLASAFGMPEGQLQRTVKSYNLAVTENGHDPFGKPLARGASPVNNPPFYTIRLWPKVHYTPGGIGINSNAHVVNLHGHLIPHLFAAGEVCGGIHGASRLGSCALTECIVFGRIAGQSAAAQSPVKADI